MDGVPAMKVLVPGVKVLVLGVNVLLPDVKVLVDVDLEVLVHGCVKLCREISGNSAGKVSEYFLEK